MRLQPFFSRRIGLDSNGNPIPLEVGGRFVYRSSKSNFGGIVMRQKENDAFPATNFFVGRYSRNFGEQNRFGGLMTVKNSEKGTNVVSTVDGFFRLGQSKSLNIMMASSSTSETGSNGFAGIAQYFYRTNQIKAWVTQSIVTKNFDPQTGFVSRKDVLGTTPGMTYYYRGKYLPFKKIIRAFEPTLTPEIYYQASTGKLLEWQTIFYPLWFNFQSGAYMGYLINPTYQHLTEKFKQIGVTLESGSYHYTRHGIFVGSNGSKTISLNGNVFWGDYFNGKLTSSNIQLQYAPTPHFSFLGRFNRNQFFQVGEQKISTTVNLYSIQARVALNPRLQLTGFYQRNSENSSNNYNIRFSWEYKPLSYVYLVYNHNDFSTLQSDKLISDNAIFKLSYIWQL